MLRFHPSHSTTVIFTCYQFSAFIPTRAPPLTDPPTDPHLLQRRKPHVVEHESELADCHAVREGDGKPADAAGEAWEEEWTAHL